MHIQNEVHAKQLTEKAKILKDRHALLDKAEFEEIKVALLSQGYGALVREYEIQSWD